MSQSNVIQTTSASNHNEEGSKQPNFLHRPRKTIRLTLLTIGLSIGAVFGYHWWHYQATHEATDDAYVTEDISPVSARVSGTVTQVLVKDNQHVDAGIVLVKLDPRDYQVALEQANAALSIAKQQAGVAQATIAVTTTNAQGQTTQAQGDIDAANASISVALATLNEKQEGIPEAQAQLAQVEANLTKAKLDYDRDQYLVQQGAYSQSQLDEAKAAYDALVAQRDATQQQVQQAQAEVAQAQENLQNAEAKLTSTKGNLQEANAAGQQTTVNQRQYKVAIAAIDQAQAQVDNAQLQLSYTAIAAPVSGVVGNKTVEVGQRTQPGQQLLVVVEQQPWITANFKETQLEKLHVGQSVEIKLDAVPNHTFLGKVDSLAPASGNQFALLPSDNATGNFTKIVQRVPVKITFDPQSIRGYESAITPGLSAVVTVSTQ